MEHEEEGKRLKLQFNALVKNYKKMERRRGDSEPRDEMQKMEDERVTHDLSLFFKDYGKFIRNRKNSIGVFSVEDYVSYKSSISRDQNNMQDIGISNNIFFGEQRETDSHKGKNFGFYKSTGNRSNCYEERIMGHGSNYGYAQMGICSDNQMFEEAANNNSRFVGHEPLNNAMRGSSSVYHVQGGTGINNINTMGKYGVDMRASSPVFGGGNTGSNYNSGSLYQDESRMSFSQLRNPNVSFDPGSQYSIRSSPSMNENLSFKGFGNSQDEETQKPYYVSNKNKESSENNKKLILQDGSSKKRSETSSANENSKSRSSLNKRGLNKRTDISDTIYGTTKLLGDSHETNYSDIKNNKLLDNNSFNNSVFNYSSPPIKSPVPKDLVLELKSPRNNQLYVNSPYNSNIQGFNPVFSKKMNAKNSNAMLNTKGKMDIFGQKAAMDDRNKQAFNKKMMVNESMKRFNKNINNSVYQKSPTDYSAYQSNTSFKKFNEDYYTNILDKTRTRNTDSPNFNFKGNAQKSVLNNLDLRFKQHNQHINPKSIYDTVPGDFASTNKENPWYHKYQGSVESHPYSGENEKVVTMRSHGVGINTYEYHKYVNTHNKQKGTVDNHMLGDVHSMSLNKEMNYNKKLILNNKNTTNENSMLFKTPQINEPNFRNDNIYKTEPMGYHRFVSPNTTPTGPSENDNYRIFNQLNRSNSNFNDGFLAGTGFKNDVKNYPLTPNLGCGQSRCIDGNNMDSKIQTEYSRYPEYMDSQRTPVINSEVQDSRFGAHVMKTQKPRHVNSKKGAQSGYFNMINYTHLDFANKNPHSGVLNKKMPNAIGRDLNQQGYFQNTQMNDMLSYPAHLDKDVHPAHPGKIFFRNGVDVESAGISSYFNGGYSNDLKYRTKRMKSDREYVEHDLSTSKEYEGSDFDSPVRIEDILAKLDIKADIPDSSKNLIYEFTDNLIEQVLFISNAIAYNRRSVCIDSKDIRLAFKTELNYDVNLNDQMEKDT